jgi:hypothetical protein
MPREGVVAEGLELEAALAAEEAWRLREAIASMDRSHDMDVDSPRLLATELGGDGSTVDPNKVTSIPSCVTDFDSITPCLLVLCIVFFFNPSSDRD